MEHVDLSKSANPDHLDLMMARSGFLDAFSDLESQICCILQSCGVATSTVPFGQRLQRFRTAEKTPLIAKTNYDRRDVIADAIAELLAVRADIVHSRMKPCHIDGETAALFVNSQEAISRFPTGRAITLAQLKSIVGQLDSLRTQVIELRRTSLNPPSSQPPPSLAAAAAL